MNDYVKNYLTAKNILWIFLAWIGVTFIVPSGNSWLVIPEEFLKHWYFYFIAESIFFALIFSFKQLLEKEYKNVLILSIISIFNLGLCYFLVFNRHINTTFIPLFHPMTISLPLIFCIEKKYVLALAGYILGYFLSFLPLIGSIVPILFLQLWFYSIDSKEPSMKVSRFLSRLIMIYIVGFLIYFLTMTIAKEGLLFPTVSFTKVQENIILSLSVITIYTIFNRYLKNYYTQYGTGLLRVLSYIPALWIIPLFEIIFKGNENKE